MRTRGLPSYFLDMMRKKLDSGRRKGRTGFDNHWRCSWPYPPLGPFGPLADGLHREVTELMIALEKGSEISILEEAADVANFAMMIADLHTNEGG